MLLGKIEERQTRERDATDPADFCGPHHQERKRKWGGNPQEGEGTSDWYK